MSKTMSINEKLAALREKMRARGIDAYIVLSEDAHQSEYVAEHWRCREWLTGFDGSAGSAVVTHTKAALWADGRYYIQAAAQITGSEFKMLRIGMDDVEIKNWLAEELPTDSVVGINGRTISVSEFKKLNEELTPLGIRFETGLDLIADIWEDRPDLPADAIFEHDIKFSGKNRIEKLNEVRELMRKKNAQGYLVSSLDDIAWLFNLRGGDIAYTPVFYAYAFVDINGAYLFADENKFDSDLKIKLAADGITLKPYNAIADFLRGYKSSGLVFIDPNRTDIYLKNQLANAALTQGKEITACLKAVKNGVEIGNIEKTQIKDGAAMVKFIKWIKENAVGLEEADIHGKLVEFRAEQPEFMGASFNAIAAYMANAASMHYNPVKGSSAKLETKGMLLVDSGGQYLGGTTDITRTIALGEISDEMKRDFTTVLRAHIALAAQRFLYGTCGCYLDVIPRRVLWAEGMDYKCGTGHGLGYFLSVHEGPQRIRFSAEDTTKLEPGMLLTNEPGVYKEGVWGIRTENTLLVADDIQTPDGRFLKFKTISYCPIDLSAIDISLLSDNERKWLNDYHRDVYEKLAPVLDDEHREWLKENTREL